MELFIYAVEKLKWSSRVFDVIWSHKVCKWLAMKVKSSQINQNGKSKKTPNSSPNTQVPSTNCQSYLNQS